MVLRCGAILGWGERERKGGEGRIGEGGGWVRIGEGRTGEGREEKRNFLFLFLFLKSMLACAHVPLLPNRQCRPFVRKGRALLPLSLKRFLPRLSKKVSAV